MGGVRRCLEAGACLQAEEAQEEAGSQPGAGPGNPSPGWKPAAWKPRLPVRKTSWVWVASRGGGPEAPRVQGQRCRGPAGRAKPGEPSHLEGAWQGPGPRWHLASWGRRLLGTDWRWPARGASTRTNKRQGGQQGQAGSGLAGGGGWGVERERAGLRLRHQGLCEPGRVEPRLRGERASREGTAAAAGEGRGSGGQGRGLPGGKGPGGSALQRDKRRVQRQGRP